MDLPFIRTLDGSEKFFRSIIKAITWRIIGTLSLLLVTYLFTKKIDITIIIGISDIIANLILYIIHERVWERVSWGRSFFDNLSFEDTKLRSFIKSLSWRILATAYLIIFSFIITDKPFISLALALTDLVLNIIEYYLHERVWNVISFGR